MKIPDWLPVFGDRDYRGECPLESAEQRSFFRALRKACPTLGRLAVHIRNESFRQKEVTAVWKAEGMSAGAPDIIIPGNPTFACEMKRLDPTKGQLSAAQIAYLEATLSVGGFACLALGAKGAWEALIQWAALANLPPPPASVKLACKPKKAAKIKTISDDVDELAVILKELEGDDHLSA